MDGRGVVTIEMTEAIAWELFFVLSNIRDCNLLQPEEVVAIELINTAIADKLRENVNA